MKIPTVKVKTQTGFKVINKSDLTETDELYVEKKPKKEPKKKQAEVSKAE